MTDNDTPMCEVCEARQPEHGRVCDGCRDAIARQLHDLIRQVTSLEVAVVPGAHRGDGVRVSTSKAGGSPVPARLDALSLLAPGTVGVTAMLHPAIRHWRTSRDVDVLTVKTSRKVIDGRIVERGDIVAERRTVVEWHRELARDDAGRPVLVADDDQIGTLPPREWLRSWVLDWQQTFHLHPGAGQLPRRYLLPHGGPKTDRSARARAVALLAADPATAAAIAVMHTVKRAYDQAVQDTLAGQSHGYAGDVRRWARTEDPVVDDLEARFGASPIAAAVREAVAFLLLWLDDACDHPDVPIDDFAGELRAVSAELTRVLGEQPDQQWLGRCPARITDPAAGTTRPCGAGLWQDPHASQVQCPRCHSTWGPRRVELMHLATEMRRTWPVDRRRRYTEQEKTTIRRPKCPACGQLADIHWKDVTGLGDKVRTWQPVAAACPAGCEEARQVI